MILDARSPSRPAGTLIDTGTGQPILHAYYAEVGEVGGRWEAYATTIGPDGVAVMQLDDHGQPVIIRGRARGTLVLRPHDGAHVFAAELKAARRSPVTISPAAKYDGVEQYGRACIEIWRRRGDSRRCAGERFDDYVAQTLGPLDWLDAYIVRRRTVPVGGMV